MTAGGKQFGPKLSDPNRKATEIPARPGSRCQLTPMQLGLIYESTLARRPWINLEQVVVHLEDDEISSAALRNAWQAVAARHEALRLSILWRKRSVPEQVIHPSVTVEPVIEDLSHLSERKQKVALDQILASDREQGVDIEAAPPWRVHFLRFGPRRGVMIWTVHHAFIDGRSMAIVLEDLFDHLSTGTLPPSADSSIPFSDYCRHLKQIETTAAGRYFKGLFEGFEGPNRLTFGGSAANGNSRQHKRQRPHALDESLSEALRERADAAGATLADLFHAAWAVVLARWTGRSEAVFGITRSGRYIAEHSSRTVGCLINTLPLRVRLDPSASCDDLLSDLRRTMLSLRPHEHAALTEVHGWAGLPGSEPLFETTVMFERGSLNRTMQSLGPAWRSRHVTLHEEGAMPITLGIYDDREILIEMEHDPGVVTTDQANAMLRHLLELLASFAKAPATMPLSQLKMLPRSEEAALISLGRPDRRAPGRLPCLATLLSDAGKAHGSAPAIALAGSPEVMTHDTLHRRANALAQKLVSAGAGPGGIVALCMDRSPEFIVAMLAVLKAGAAFLPVDPSYPADVASHMLTDSGARLVLTRDGVDFATDLPRLSPDAGEADTPPELPPPDPDRLAYVIYTSGSTGRPKGVKVPMLAITAHASAMEMHYRLTPQDKVLQFASLSFDVSIEEILPTLLSGATLVLRNESMATSIPAFLEEIHGKGVTVMNLPTAFWHVLVDELARSGLTMPKSVRLVIVGGERIDPRTLARWQDLAPDIRWLNGYGPTEATITCTLHEPGPITGEDDIPIGRPTAHACAYVLAPDGSLAPLGAPGELCIGGNAVALGYLNRPEDTAKSFLPDAFAGRGRLYRTGDRARWRSDGALDFLGRSDRQVKLRGFRIDLRQIEQVLERVPEVGLALVRVLSQGTPQARLVAWVTAGKGMGLPDLGRLRERIARELPAHMVPALVAMPDFPHTPGGKIDTAALPLPEAVEPQVETRLPADEMTLRIATLMARILGLKQVAPDDRFHDLGGHSLLAVRLIGLIETELGYRLGVGDLHRHPSARAIAGLIQNAQTGPRYIIPIQPEGKGAPIFGVHVLGRNESYYRPLAEALGPDQPVYGLTVGLLTQDTPIGVEATAKVYFDDIQRHFPTGPISLAAVSLGSYIAFELAQQLITAGREVRMLALFDAAGPGGRSRLHGLARIAAHGRRFRREGAGYALTLLSNKLTNLQNWIEKARVQMAGTKGDTAPLTIGSFVAANELAVQAYQAQPIDLPITIFRAKADVFDSPESREQGLGWAPVAEAGFDLIDVPGDHLGMLAPPHVTELARQISRILASRRR